MALAIEKVLMGSADGTTVLVSVSIRAANRKVYKKTPGGPGAVY
jgi:hypothetical protein